MFSARFHDYDAYTDAIQRVDAGFMLQKLEKRHWQIEGLVLPAGVTIQHCLSGSGAIAQGAAESDGVELAIPASGHYLANGKKVPPGGALLMRKGREFMVSIEGSHRWFNVFVPQSQAYQTRIQLTEQGRELNDRDILDNGSRSANVAALLIRFFSIALASRDISASYDALASFQDELLAKLAADYGSQPEATSKHRGRPAIVDKESILKAVDAIEASTKPTIPISKLADIAQVSERSIRAGFHKYLGISPTTYMQLRTLNRAWHQLATGSADETTVARVATDLGIWDLGRFAMRYRKLFGELPSETLQRP